MDADWKLAEEAVAMMGAEIGKEQQKLYETLGRLRTYRDDARTQGDYDAITKQMKDASIRHDAAIAPLRAERERLIKAMASVKAFETVTMFIPTDPTTSS